MQNALILVFSLFTDNRMTELHQGYNTVKMLGIAIGLMTGLVFLVIVALVTVMVRQRSKTGSGKSGRVL